MHEKIVKACFQFFKTLASPSNYIVSFSTTTPIDGNGDFLGPKLGALLTPLPSQFNAPIPLTIKWSKPKPYLIQLDSELTHMAHPIHQANVKSPFGDLTRQEFYQKHNIFHQESFIHNHQDMSIYTQSWHSATASPSQLKGLVAMVHGYTSESGWLFQLTAVALAKQGFLAVVLDLRGHGRSDGMPRTHITDIEQVVSDCVQVFDASREANPTLPAFLYGESLGGAIAMLIALRQKNVWSGLVLNGSMCGLSRRNKPVWPLDEFLPLAAFIVPKWRVLFFTKSLVEKSYRVKWKRELVRSSPTAHGSEHPTFASALEFTRLVGEMERRCGELEVPLLMVHGSDDRICDLESTELVFKLIGSKDKTLKILQGMGHQLIGEDEESVEYGFEIIFSWLKDRAMRASVTSSNVHA